MDSRSLDLGLDLDLVDSYVAWLEKDNLGEGELEKIMGTPPVQPIPSEIVSQTSDSTEQPVKTTVSASRAQKRKRLPKNQTWIFNDSLDVVDPEIKPESKDGKMFVNGRQVILQSKLYNETVFERQQRPPIYIPLTSLRGKNWVFSENGESVPLDKNAAKITPKSFTVDDKPIITWGGFLKRRFAFADTRDLLTTPEKRQMVYDEAKKCFFLNNRPIILSERSNRLSYSVPKKPRTESITAKTTVVDDNPSPSGKVLQSFYNSGNPTLFAGISSPKETSTSSDIQAEHTKRQGYTSGV